MKKKIEAELLKIAEKIIEQKGNFNTTQLKNHTQLLYEKLTILDFTVRNLEKEQPVKQEFSDKSHVPESENMVPPYDEHYPDGTEYNEDAITELNTEKIKDIVAQMPPETQKVDRIMHSINTAPETPKFEKQREEPKKDFRNIGVDYDNLPDFEPVNHVEKDAKPRSLNDRLKKGINIGLNERLTYIKHLFGGNTTDYNRVLSQLNTFSNLEEANKFIEKVVKPDYNHWEGKEEYEERFMSHIYNKFGE
ncbi:hypothetical protein [Gramella sp. AN32]|uniref:Uncharacterized protein n=1 Tax=Christiangramia antarctica TaxID=2058158 RepID=A0ABW5X174_9FLAO|nr:hypothetical protein [Gramella sp. AN32]MCM4154943.1 hypothetical protein [Gramella sp. AN32]